MVAIKPPVPIVDLYIMSSIAFSRLQDQVGVCSDQRLMTSRTRPVVVSYVQCPHMVNGFVWVGEPTCAYTIVLDPVIKANLLAFFVGSLNGGFFACVY